MCIKTKSHKQQQGIMTLMLSVILLAAMSLSVVNIGNMINTEQKIYNNQYRNQQAFSAAQAGIEYGLQYLKNNKTSIVVDSNNDGQIDSNVLVTQLANSSDFSLRISNTTTQNFDLIQLSSVGRSDDGASTRELRQQVQWKSLIPYLPPVPVIARNNASLSGNASVLNMHDQYTIWAGNNVSYQGNSSSQTASHLSDKFFMDADVLNNDSNLNNSTTDAFFQNFFGSSKSAVSQSADIYLSGSGNSNYSSDVSGVTGKSIWIEQSSGSASINGNTTIGSVNQPVLLIVNGEAKLNGNLTIYGAVYFTSSNSKLNGNLDIYGTVIAENNLEIANGNLDVIYHPTVINNLKANMGQYMIVAGSWNDMKL